MVQAPTHNPYPRLVAGGALRLLIAAALYKLMYAIVPLVMEWPVPALIALYGIILVPIALALFTGFWHLLAVVMNAVTTKPPDTVFHVTGSDAARSIGTSGIIERGSSVLTNLGSGVYVRECSAGGRLTTYQRLSQCFSVNGRAPFTHFHDPTDLIAIPIRVRHPERLVVNALAPNRAWVVWGDIHRIGNEFEI